MRLLFAGTKQRGVNCLSALLADGHEIAAVICPPYVGAPKPGSVAESALHRGLRVATPPDVNAPQTVSELAALQPELTVLADFGQIVKQPFLGIAPRGAINLHGGRLPEWRGSSPLNWVLIHGQSEFSISVIRVDLGVDTGDVLAEQTFRIDIDDTIATLHAQANECFPRLLSRVVREIAAGTVTGRRQDPSRAGYYPLRFPDDGFVLFDQLTAHEVHNRIRALTDPYPGAFTFYQRRKVTLLASRLTERPFYGEPGRIYRKTGAGLLVCAKDRCLWILRATFADDGQDALAALPRYETLATLQGLALAALTT